jgi:hypothetical protein
LRKPEVSSRPEAAFVLLLMQSTFWVIAGLSAIPFAFAGEIFMLALGLASLLVALATCLLAIGVLWRRRWARRSVIALEITCLSGSVLLLVLPIGANHGPVALMTNVLLPVVIFLLVRKPRHATPLGESNLARSTDASAA